MMKTKASVLVSALVLSIVFLVSFASAIITFSNVPTTLPLPSTSGSFTFNMDVTTNETEGITFTAAPIIYNGKQITFNTLTSSFSNNTLKTITITYVVPTDFEFDLGEPYSTTIIADGTISDNLTRTISFQDPEYCEESQSFGLGIDITDTTTKSGFGDDDSYWYPGDEVEIEVEVSPGNYDIQNIGVDWCLYDKDQKKCVLDGDESDFDLDENDDEEVLTISLYLDPKKLDSNSNDYIFYIRATGTVDDNDAGSNDNAKVCDSDYDDSVDIRVDNHFVVLTNLDYLETTQCGSSLHLTSDVWNIGDNDEDDVYVRVYNAELGINQQVDIGDIDSFDDGNLDITLNIPENAEEKLYELKLEVYDEDDDIFQNDEDDEAVFSFPVEVKGGCAKPITAELSSDAELVEGGVAGENLVAKLTLTNTGEETQTFTVSISQPEWASSAELEESVFTINSGEAKEMTMTLGVNKDVSGEQTFNVTVMSGNDLVTSRDVMVTIEEKKGFWNSLGITGNVIGGDNWYLWGIGVLNVILIIIIIVVAIRVAKS